MVLEALEALLIPISTFITLITASVGGWLALREYRLKARAETRLAQTAELESDVKLIKLFIEIMNIAHGRSGYGTSEKAIEKILTPENIKKFGLTGHTVGDLINETIIKFPVGVAEQNAAICAIWVLGKKHPILTTIAIEALESLIEQFKGKIVEIMKSYVKDLRDNYNPQ